MLEDLRYNMSKRYTSIVGWVRFLSLFKNCTHISLLPFVGYSATVYRVLRDRCWLVYSKSFEEPGWNLVGATGIVRV